MSIKKIYDHLKMATVVTVVFMFFFSNTKGQEKDQLDSGKSGKDAYISSGVNKPLDISTLPKHINRQSGKLQLFADPSTISENKVDLYLINNSNKFINFERENDDIYVKMEFKDEFGNWVRAQSHLYSWCGNSYGKTSFLKPGYYFKLIGYCPTQGQTAEVRYKQYNTDIALISNSFPGFVDLKEIKIADIDYISIKMKTSEELVNIALGKTIIVEHKQQYINPRIMALDLIAKQDKNIISVIPLLKEIATDKDRFISNYAKEMLTRIENDLNEKIILNSQKSPKLSNEENRILSTTRDLILNPVRKKVVINSSLEDAIKLLNKAFPQQHVSIEVDEKLGKFPIKITERKTTLGEALVFIANGSSSLNVGEDFSLYENTEADYEINLPLQCGILSLRVSKYDDPSPTITFHWNYGIKQLNFQNIEIGNIKVVFPNEYSYEPECNNFNLLVTQKEFENYGGSIKELSGTLYLPVPTKIRSKTVRSKKFSNELAEKWASRYWSLYAFPQEDKTYTFRLEISKSDQTASFPTEESNTYDTGTLLLLDKNKNQLMGNFSSYRDLKSDYEMTNLPMPHYLSYQVVTEFEIMEIPFSFKDILIPSRFWTVGQSNE